MKKYLIILGLTLSLLSLSSCKKSFLDPPVDNYITEEYRAELVKDPKVLNDIIDASLAASYNSLQEFWESHDDFGLTAFHLASDMYGEDIAYRGGWFQFDYMYENYGANYRRTRTTWNMFYGLVSNSNLLLRDYFSEESSDPSFLAAQAKPIAVRGIAFYYLTNFYQASYEGNEGKWGVPLPLKPEDEYLPRATVKECYDRIVADLTFAVDNGAVTSDNRGDADRAVAAAYLAKTYAQMKDWPNVEKYAKIAQEGGSDAVQKYPPKWSIDNGDVLWGFDVTAQTSTSWASFYAHMDPTIRFYAGGGQYKLIYNWLYAQMGEKDVRRTLYVHDKNNHAIAKENGFDEYTDDEGIVHNFDYISLKFKTTEAANTDYIFLRVQDPILLEIEALVEQNKLAEAKEKLAAFMEPRDPEYVVGNTQDELREQVRITRRIELWAEGSALNDFKRWNLTVDRTKGIPNAAGEIVSNHGYKAKIDLNDIEYIHKLPQREVNNNKELIQN